MVWVTYYLTTHLSFVRGFLRPTTARSSLRCSAQSGYADEKQTFEAGGLHFQDRVIITPNLNVSSWDDYWDNVEQKVRGDVEYLFELDRAARGDVVDDMLQSMDRPIRVADDPLSINIGRFIVAIRELLTWVVWQIGKNTRGDIQGENLVGEIKLRLTQGFTIIDGSAGSAILDDLEASSLSTLAEEEDDHDSDWGSIYFDSEDSSVTTQASTPATSFSSKFVELSDFYDCFVEQADRSDYEFLDTAIAGRWRTHQHGVIYGSDEVISGMAGTNIYFEGSDLS